MSKVILSLCDLTGTWSKPYKDRGYKVIQVDLQTNKDQDIRLLQVGGTKGSSLGTWEPGEVHGIIAQPPCTDFTVAGARWWAAKGPEKLLFSLSLVDACLRAVAVYRPAWWVLENPVGRLKSYLGKPRAIFHPWHYAGYREQPGETVPRTDRYTKQTCLWGNFTMPERKALAPVLGTPEQPAQGSSWIHRLGPSDDRANLRSMSPEGFSLAFCLANP